jgi:hypothetical protein
MTPLDFTNIDETLTRPLAGAVVPEPRTALVPLPAYDRYLTACRAALAACRNAGEVKEVRNRAAALKEYARQAKDKTLEADAYEIRARAERRLGEMLIEQKETVGFANGGDAQRTRFHPGTESPPTLAEAGIDKKLSMTAQRLAKLPGSEFECIVAEDRERIIAFGREHAPLDNLKGGVEWYTPLAWIERARTAMGSIDLDPASCEFAQQRFVKATEWFDIERNGLAQPWRGNVFLNPPYARGVIDEFVDKLIAERTNYTQAIVLVDNRSDTAWFHQLCGIASAVALPKGRIGFYSDNPDARAPSVWGSAFVYVGDRLGAFAAAFSSCLILQEAGDAARP